jgi:hypothetical protein
MKGKDLALDEVVVLKVEVQEDQESLVDRQVTIEEVVMEAI